MSEWVLPFRGRNGSLATKQNFLWRSQNIYIMDNHRAAFWCWLRHQNTNEMHSIVHIDAHYDTAAAGARTMDSVPGDVAEKSFEDYLAISYPDENIPVFRWDNYLSIYSKLYGNCLSECLFATHQIGSKPNFAYEEVTAAQLVPALQVRDLEIPQIINLDLDYFLSPDNDRIPKARRVEITRSLKAFYDANICSVMTICLSPECCGGWRRAEELCAEVCGTFNLPFTLGE
ncbi:MAG: UPF0489 family protein [Gammaproteobacteria bacterium]|jgi:hypothetical protein